MLELRWVLKPNVIADVFAQPVKVLQYRQGSYPYQPPHEKEWSGTDWIDVPTVPDQPADAIPGTPDGA